MSYVGLRTVVCIACVFYHLRLNLDNRFSAMGHNRPRGIISTYSFGRSVSFNIDDFGKCSYIRQVPIKIHVLHFSLIIRNT
jgi:hypothetical protein